MSKDEFINAIISIFAGGGVGAIFFGLLHKIQMIFKRNNRDWAKTLREVAKKFSRCLDEDRPRKKRKGKKK